MWSPHHEAHNQRLSPQGDAQWSKRNTNRIDISFLAHQETASYQKQIYNCVVCRRHEGRSYKVEPSSDMPEFRFKEGYPFASTGVDFAGPLFVKTVFGKELQVTNVYICLFTCGSTRAIHIELTPSLTTQAFIRCLRRFAARRGIPELIISNNPKTFKAAPTQLTTIFNDPDVISFLLERKIQWKFNLEKAPWWGFFLKEWWRVPNVVWRKHLERLAWLMRSYWQFWLKLNAYWTPDH